MKLPDIGNAIIEEAKIVEYLLDAAHPDNGGKAAFFLRWGFSTRDWTVLAKALLEMARRNDVIRRIQSRWGQKFVVDGTLDAPGGTTPRVRTVWIVDRSQAGPRLVTAYPSE